MTKAQKRRKVIQLATKILSMEVPKEVFNYALGSVRDWDMPYWLMLWSGYQKLFYSTPHNIEVFSKYAEIALESSCKMLYDCKLSKITERDHTAGDMLNDIIFRM